MKNLPLQQAVIASLVQKSVLLTEEKKKTILAKLPTMTWEQLEELQKLIGGEEKVVLHPKELGVEELLKTGDKKILKPLGILLDDSIRQLQKVEQKAGEAMDAANVNAILADLS